MAVTINPAIQETPVIASSGGMFEMQYAGQLMKGRIRNFQVDVRAQANELTEVDISISITSEVFSAANDARNVELAKQLVRVVKVLYEPPTDS